MTDQVVTSHTSVTTSPGTVNMKDSASGSGTGTTRNVQYRADQLSMCHGFTPPGHVAELIFQASRLNSAAGTVAYHGIQTPMAVGPLGNLRSYQRPEDGLNTPGLVQIGSGGVIGLSPTMAHQNAEHTVHASGSPAVLGHVTDGTNQVMHVSSLTGRLVGTQNTVMQGIENTVQDLSNTPGFQNVSAVSADAGLNKMSDPSSGIMVAADHTNAAVNYSSMPAVSDNGPKGGTMGLPSNMLKAGISVIPSSGFSTALYPNLIVAEGMAKGNVVTSSINSNYGNLTYLGLTLANTNIAGQSPLLVATGGNNPVAPGSCVQHPMAGIDMTATSSQANDLSKTTASTSQNTPGATSTKSSTTTSTVPIISTSGHVQCTTLDAIASGAILSGEDSALSVCLMQGIPDARGAEQLAKGITTEVLAGKVKIQTQTNPSDSPGSPPLVSTEDACQCLMTAIVYMEQHPSLATDHADMLRKILQHVIEDDHNTTMAKCNEETVKLETGLEEEESNMKVNGGSCNVTQWVVANPYRCKNCGKRFPQYSLLSEHMVIHSNGSLWQCTACEKTFADEDGLKVHKKLECDSCRRCDMCGKGLAPSNNLEKHKGILSGLKSHSCNVCTKCFADLNSVKKHVTTHSGEKPFECPTCSRRFAQLCNLQTHTKFHTKEKPHVCPICNKSYAHSSDLRRHCLRIHGCRDPGSIISCIERATLPASFITHFGRRKKSRNTGRYACTECEKRFQRAKDLQRHMRIHTGEKPYTCNTCGKKFADPSAIRVHNLIHTGERPHKCTICGKGFRQSSTLHTHMRLHSGERPFLCTLCGKSFATPGYLSHHMKYHGEKTFRCGVCGQGFVTTVDLQRHSVVHTGEKPYKCNICGKGFGWERNLKTHMKTHNDVSQ